MLLLFASFFPLPTISLASVTATASIDRSEITVGDQIRYTLTVTADKGEEVDLPDERLDIFPFEVIVYRPFPPEGEGDKTARRVDYTITAYDVGEMEIPPVAVIYREKGGREREVRTEGLKVNVKSVVPKEGAEIKDIKGPMAMKGGKGMGLLVLAAALGILAIVVILLLALRRKEEASLTLMTTPTAKEEALMALDEIERMGLLERGEILRYYTMVADAVRGYLVKGLKIDAFEMTTGEILDAAGSQGSGVGSETLGSFFRECDLIKFAGKVPVSPVKLIDQAREVIGGLP
jgi:hypothetical protein